MPLLSRTMVSGVPPTAPRSPVRAPRIRPTSGRLAEVVAAGGPVDVLALPVTTGGDVQPGPGTRQAVSQHIDVLIEAGLIATRREGRYKFHHLDQRPLERIADRWLSASQEQS